MPIQTALPSTDPQLLPPWLSWLDAEAGIHKEHTGKAFKDAAELKGSLLLWVPSVGAADSNKNHLKDAVPRALGGTMYLGKSATELTSREGDPISLLTCRTTSRHCWSRKSSPLNLPPSSLLSQCFWSLSELLNSLAPMPSGLNGRTYFDCSMCCGRS